MMNNERDFGYSLHHINQDYDSSAVIDIRSHPIDYGKSMLGLMNDVYPVGVDTILDAIERFAKGNELPAVEQDPGKSGYYSVPTTGDLEVARRRNVKLVEKFAEPGRGEELTVVIEEAVRE